MSNSVTIKNIIDEINLENGSNYKMEVLKKYKDNELFKRVLQLTYDKVKYTFGVSMKNVKYNPCNKRANDFKLESALDFIEEKLCTREITGNKAIFNLESLFEHLSLDDAEVLKMIIDRDLRINLGKTNINKIYKNLITKPPYMRCSLMDKIDRITYPGIVQNKADGTFRYLISNDNVLTLMSRSGEIQEFNNFFNKLPSLPDGVYTGELLIRSCYGSKNRMKANGLINSKTEPDDLYMQLWDYLTLEEFSEKKSTVPYIDRFYKLTELTEDYHDLEIIESKIVNNYSEAKEFYSSMIEKGLEGAVLKNLNAPFKDGTSSEMTKMKEEAVSEFVVTGYQEGKGRLKGTLGAMFYESSDSKVQGKMAGFSDEIRDYIWNNQDELLGSIVSVKYNGISKAKVKDTYSLLFATFEELRPDKSTADDYLYIKSALK